MEVSSTITTSQLSGFRALWTKTISPVSGETSTSSRRWIVLASRPVTSVRRFAARPVGAASKVL